MTIINNSQYLWVYNHIKPFYEAPYRHFHNMVHLNTGLNIISALNLSLNSEQYIAWLFHDIVYFPGYDKNEQMSAQYMVDFCKTHDLKINIDLAYQIVMDTKTHKPTCDESKTVLDMDMYTLGQPSYKYFRTDRINVVLEYEKFCGGTAIAEKGVLEFLKNIKDENIFCTTDFQKFQSCFEYNANQYIESGGNVLFYTHIQT